MRWTTGVPFPAEATKGFFLSPSPDPGLTQPPIQWVHGSLSLGIKRPGRESEHSYLSKGKVVPVPVLNEHHAMEAYGGVEVQFHVFLTSALDGGELSASRLSHFTTTERAPRTHWTGGRVGLRAGLHAVVKRKIPSANVKNE
jgi:hypothetical protein